MKAEQREGRGVGGWMDGMDLHDSLFPQAATGCIKFKFQGYYLKHFQNNHW